MGLFVINEYKPYQAYCYSDELIPWQRFMVEEIPDEQKRYCQERALYDKSCADLPACFICIDPARLQSDDGDTENRPLSPFLLGGLAIYFI